MESGMLDDFIERKHGRQAIVYVFEALEEILKPTYGVIVYQEQVMQIVQTIGGFSLGGADIVRRAMGKKKVDEMLKYNKEFSEGAQKQGLDYKTASELFDLIEKFAGYGFNKSHSAAYAMVTFQTAWLKTYYPQEFMAALLTSEKDNTDKIVKYIDESKRMGIDLLPPDVNLSVLEFSATKKEGKDVILFGMGAIKGMGDSATKSILETRQEGQFNDMNDFINRIDTSKVNKRVIESLAKSGGFDQFGISRHALLEQVEILVSTAAEANRAKKMAVGSLFGDDSEMTTVELQLVDMTEYELKQILALEKETLGIYVSGHPLDEYKAQLDKLNYTLSSAIEDLGDGSSIIIIGKVEEIQEKISKKGNKFGIVNLMDYHGNIEFMLFADMLEELQECNLEEPLAFKVKIQKDDQFTRISARKILTLRDVNKQKTKEVAYVAPPEPEAPLNVFLDLSRSEELLLEFYRLARAHPGSRKLHITLTSKLQNVVIDSKFSVNSEIINKIEALGLKIA